LNIRLDGWSGQIFENKQDYREVLSELYLKYSGGGKMMPEVKLLLLIAQSGFMFHLSQSMFGETQTVPSNFDEICKANPKVKQLFEETQAELTSKKGVPNIPDTSKKTNILGYVMGNLFNNSPLGGLFGNNNPVAQYAQNQKQPQQGNGPIRPPQDPDNIL